MPGESFRCIAVDMGAGSIRVMLGQLSHGGISYREMHRFENRIVHVDGHDCWDVERIVEGIGTGIRKTLEEAQGVESIGVDAWGVDYILVDSFGGLLGPALSYRDGRTGGMRERWRMRMSEAETFRRTGINFYVFNTLFQLLSQQGEPVLQAFDRLLFMPSYINYLISGSMANEVTIASTSQMLGVNGNTWDQEILAGLSLDAARLEPVVSPGTRLGPMRWPADRPEVSCVAVCGHDTACVVASLPAEGRDFAYISAGTWCVVGIETEQALATGEALREGFTNERGYGNRYRVLKNIVGLWLVQGLRKEIPGKPSYEALAAMAEDAGEVDQVINPEDPLFYNPASMKDAFDQFLRQTGQTLPRDMGGYLRCAYDSLCFSFRYHLEQLEALSGNSIRLLHMVGGGSQSDYLNQRSADICERPLRPGPVEGATLGNVLVQAMAMGRLEDLEQGRALVSRSFPGKHYTPAGLDVRSRQRYDQFLTLKNTTNTYNK